LYWLVTGRRLPGAVGRLGTASYAFVNPFAGAGGDVRPPEIRELFSRPEYQWEPGPDDIPRWFDLWARAAALVSLQRPTSIRHAQQQAQREHKPDESVAEGEVERAAGGDRGVSGLAGEVVECAERTLAADGVKIEWRQDRRTYIPPTARPPGRPSPLSPVRRLAWEAVKAEWKRAFGDFQVGHMAGKGVLGPSTGRYMVDYGAFAQIHEGRQTFGGRSGRALTTLNPFSSQGWHGGPMWLLQALRGTTDATDEGDESLRGIPCQRLAVRCDLDRVFAASAPKFPDAVTDRLKRHQLLPVTVWIGGDYIRRVRVSDVMQRDLTLELWDYGTAIEEFDWSRLPTFRSLAEHAMYAGERKPWRHRLLRRRRAITGK
jgi:hypothetical protein